MSTFNPGGIKIIGSDPYEDAVEKQLSAILKNPVGQLLLDYIDDNPKYIRIVPSTDEECGDNVQADHDRDSVAKNVTPYLGYADGEQRYYNAEGRLVLSSRDDKANWSGTGQGTDVHVRYSPGNYGGTACGGGVFGSQPDEVLMHELVHSYRKMAAIFNPVPTETKLFSYLNEEEWWAILLTNIYIAVKNGHNRNLRADHNGHEQLKYPLNTSDGFMNDDAHRKLVRKHIGEQPLFSWELHQISSVYNPIAEYIRNVDKYRRM
jgi:hypothetical protein